MATRLVFARGRAQERRMHSDLNETFADLDDDTLIIALENITANTTFTVPAGYRLSSLDIVETAGVAVTGGIRVGKTAGTADAVAATAVGANALVSVPDANFVQRLYSIDTDQTLFLEAVTDWGPGASLRVRAILEQEFEA